MNSLLLVALAALLALALANSHNNYQAKSIQTSELDEEAVCAFIGQNSGCSGCVHGTKGQCTWAGIRQGEKEKKRSGVYFDTAAVDFLCIPTSQLAVFIAESGAWFDGSTVCPSNPGKEPMLRNIVEDTDATGYPQASVIFTQAFDDPAIDWPTIPWPVDRTSFYGAAGLGLSVVAGAYLDCAAVSVPELVRLQYEGINKSATYLNGYLYSERDKFCVRITMAEYLSSRCPQYGVAVSGICNSFYQRILTNCLGHVNVGSIKNGVEPYAKSLESWTVVPDSTPHCLNAFPVWPGGEYGALAGLDTPVEELQALFSSLSPKVLYDCDEIACSSPR